MSDLNEISDPQAAVEAALTQSQDQPETPAEAPSEESQGNPAWESLRTKLDPIAFKAIEPDLKTWETEAQRRIESNNKQYGWAADLVKSGTTPEDIQRALLVATKLNENPEEIHQALGQFLRENGRLPDKQELADKVDEIQEDGPKADPRIDQLAAQQEQIANFIQSQQAEQIQAAADKALDQEIKALEAAHPEFSKEDIHEVISRAAFAAQLSKNQGKNTFPTLEEMAKDYNDNVRNRILSAPRAGGTAPRLLPTSGGVATSAATQKTIGSLENGQVQDLVAQLLSQNKG